MNAPPAPARAPRLPRNVVALGVVSLLNDVSSEMMLPVLPLFVTGVLGASVASLGVIEGVAESTAALLRLSSGWLSDRIGRRKPFLVAGYGISGVTKAALAYAATWPAVLALRFADRVGKGLRSPARDALIADSVTPGVRGRAFGLHRAMDSIGAAIGPVLAFALLAAWPGEFRRLFLVTAIPALLSVVVLAIFVRAPRPAAHAAAAGGARTKLPAAFWKFCIADGVFQLANSSMAFVLLRAKDSGLAVATVPLAYAGYQLFYAALSYPAGVVADRVGRRALLAGAYLLYAGVYLWLALDGGRVAAIGALALLGVHSALLDVSERALVSDLAGEAGRATAFGVYYTVVGIALLPASLLAGALWERFGAGVTFAVDAALALAAALLFVTLCGAGAARKGAARAAE